MNDRRGMKDRQLAVIFTGADAGAFTLPTEWKDARRGLDVLEERRGMATRRAGAERDRAAHAPAARAAELVDLAGHDKLPGSLSGPIVEARQAVAEAEEDLMVIGQAVLLATDSLRGRLRRDSDAFITGHLRPALDATVEAVRNATPALAGVDLEDPASLARAKQPAREAFMAVAEAAVRYEAIRDAQDALWKIARRTMTVEAQTQSGGRTPGIRSAGRNEWPHGRVAGMVALAKAKTWIPTAAEQAKDEAERGREARELTKALGGHSIPVGSGF